MLRLLEVESIHKETKKQGGCTIIKFQNNEQIIKLKQGLNVDMKKEKYMFCNVKQEHIEKLPWKLYNDNDGNDVYEKWKDNKSNSCHYGLKIDKFTNIFNVRECEYGKVEKYIHSNIDEYLKEGRNLYEDINLKAKVLDRLIVGLGENSVFETDIKLHHTYGIPYIPASAVKGCFRSYIIQKYSENVQKEEWFNRIFGGVINKEMCKGSIIFMDAFPINTFKIKKDIMTPHYQQGYTDDGAITPIEFLTVEDTTFRFVLRINKRSFLNSYIEQIKIENKQVKDFIMEEMINMISTHGIGAKTSVGYGYLGISKE